MSLEGLLIPLLSGIVGWALRHYGVIAPGQATPQSRPASGGTSPPAPAQADLPSMIQSVVQAEMRALISYLETKLPQSSSLST